jgi:hypothetical protein
MIEMIEWSEPIIEELARRRVIIYLGSGTSPACKSKDGKSIRRRGRRYFVPH